MKMALGDRIGGRLIARFKLKAAQLRLDCHHNRAPNWRIMTTHPICFDSAAESTKSQESINRSRYYWRADSSYIARVLKHAVDKVFGCRHDPVNQGRNDEIIRQRSGPELQAYLIGWHAGVAGRPCPKLDGFLEDIDCGYQEGHRHWTRRQAT